MIDQSLNDVAMALLQNSLNIEDRAARGGFVKILA